MGALVLHPAEGVREGSLTAQEFCALIITQLLIEFTVWLLRDIQGLRNLFWGLLMTLFTAKSENSQDVGCLQV